MGISAHMRPGFGINIISSDGSECSPVEVEWTLRKFSWWLVQLLLAIDRLHLFQIYRVAINYWRANGSSKELEIGWKHPDRPHSVNTRWTRSTKKKIIMNMMNSMPKTYGIAYKSVQNIAKNSLVLGIYRLFERKYLTEAVKQKGIDKYTKRMLKFIKVSGFSHWNGTKITVNCSVPHRRIKEREKQI